MRIGQNHDDLSLRLEGEGITLGFPTYQVQGHCKEKAANRKVYDQPIELNAWAIESDK